MARLHDGFRVVGPNSADGGFSVWYFPTRKEADAFAQSAAETTRGSFDILKPLGYWEAPMPAVEWHDAPKAKRDKRKPKA